MSLAQPGPQKQVLPLGLMQPSASLLGGLQLFFQQGFRSLQSPRERPLLLRGRGRREPVPWPPAPQGRRSCLLIPTRPHTPEALWAPPLPSICLVLCRLFPGTPSLAPGPALLLCRPCLFVYVGPPLLPRNCLPRSQPSRLYLLGPTAKDSLQIPSPLHLALPSSLGPTLTYNPYRPPLHLPHPPEGLCADTTSPIFPSHDCSLGKD